MTMTMTTRLCAVLLSAAAVAGCAGADACDGVAGECLGLRITGSGSVDQVRVVASGATTSDGLTPPVAGPRVSLPILTALALPSGTSGVINLAVTGLIGGNAVGHGSAQVTVSPNERRTIDVALSSGAGDGGVDLSVGDLGANDLAAPHDMALPDLAIAQDLLFAPRHTFLLTARTGSLGTLAALDAACTAEAHQARLSGAIYRAVIGYEQTQPYDHIQLLTIAKPIVTPSGTVVAVDNSFFQFGGHAASINELSNGSPYTQACVWTNFGPTGITIEGAPGDCNNWQQTDGGSTANVGSVTDPSSWYLEGNNSCGNPCHVYCIEQ